MFGYRARIGYTAPLVVMEVFPFALEQELGKNVVTSTQAIIWHALRRVAVTDAIAGWGRLLRDH
jgi:maleate cis-trans isomerase